MHCLIYPVDCQLKLEKSEALMSKQNHDLSHDFLAFLKKEKKSITSEGKYLFIIGSLEG